ncbi:MAG: hypothetical protein A2X46_01195 [Lentisphaerae bacterium GWF2_57_35]|nr:MAG: hypothetical protein A2X46_01195 [Lentisphaerae bacterium GWF2_57_35]
MDECGTSVHARNVLQTLKEAGHEIDVLCFPWGGHSDPPGIRMIRLGRWLWRRRSSACSFHLRAWLDLWMFWRAVGLFLARPYDVVHALQESVFAGALLKRLFRCRLVYDVKFPISDKVHQHGFLLLRPWFRLLERYETHALASADLVLTMCPSLTDWVRAAVPSVRAVQIENAPLTPCGHADSDAVRRLRDDLKLKGGPVVFCGDLFGPCEGAELFVKASRIVAKNRPDAEFLVMSCDDARLRRLKKLAQSLDLSDRFSFLVSPHSSMLPPLLTLSSVLVFSGVRGIVAPPELITCMQSGKPIVATRLPRHTQSLDESCAVLVMPQPDDVAAGILRALDESLLSNAMGREAQARVAAHGGLASFKHKVRTAYRILMEA